MRRFWAAICAAGLLISGCSEEKNPVPEKTLSEVVDVDLTKLSKTKRNNDLFGCV